MVEYQLKKIKNQNISTKIISEQDNRVLEKKLSEA